MKLVVAFLTFNCLAATLLRAHDVESDIQLQPAYPSVQPSRATVFKGHHHECVSSFADCREKENCCDQEQPSNVKITSKVRRIDCDVKDCCDSEVNGNTAMMSNASHYVTTLAGVRMPKLIYGTAWKKDATTDLVVKALMLGFRGIDTACQPKHYNEPGVGAAVKKVIADGLVKREDVFIQTKFTSVDGQDPNRIPYDPKAPLQSQVEQSLMTSLRNFDTAYIDSIVLHSPMKTFAETMTVWKTLESFVDDGKILQLGISNCYDLSMLKRIWEAARIKPAILQNRFYADSGYDVGIRNFAKQHNIYYQSFWTLSANPHVLKSPTVLELASKYGKTAEQIFFSYLIHYAGIVPLTGTKDEVHMKQDLESMDFNIQENEKSVFDAMFK